MLNANKTSKTRHTLTAVAIAVVLSVVVMNVEKHHAAVINDESISAPAAESAWTPPNDFDYLPSHFPAPSGPVEDLPPQF